MIKEAFKHLQSMMFAVALMFAMMFIVPGAVQEVYAEEITESHECTWDEGEVTEEATCVKVGTMTYKCTDSECELTKTEEIQMKDHSYSTKYTIDKEATESEDGSKSLHCTAENCDAKKDETVIPKISSKKLSYNFKVYNGKEQTKPSVIIKNSEQKQLVEGTDYSVSYPKSIKAVNNYSVVVTYKGAYKGKSTLGFAIVPKAPGKIEAKIDTATLGGYDDVKLTWEKSTGATGYLVYYKKDTSSKWSGPKTTTNTSYTIKDLADGKKYNFRVFAYYKPSSGEKKYYDNYLYAKVNKTALKKGKGIYTSKSGKTYCEYAKGKKAKNTFITNGKKTYYFDKNGVMVTGWMKKSSSYYYFDRSTGVQKKNCKIDGITIKKTGKASVDKVKKKKIELMITARKQMLKIVKASDSKSQKLKKTFKWVLKHPYKRYRILHKARGTKGWEVTFANDIFKKGKGCCVSEACAFAFMAKECGYKTVYVADDTAHAWVQIDGRVYDTLFAEAKKGGMKKYYKGTYKKTGLHCVNKTKI